MLVYPLAQGAFSYAAARYGKPTFGKSAYFIPCEHDVIHQPPQQADCGIPDTGRYRKNGASYTHGLCQQFPECPEAVGFCSRGIDDAVLLCLFRLVHGGFRKIPNMQWLNEVFSAAERGHGGQVSQAPGHVVDEDGLPWCLSEEYGRP